MLTDVMMPELDGVALANEARRLRPDLGILYVSGFQDQDRFRGDRKHGPVLSKPYRRDQLLASINAVLGSLSKK